MSRIGRFLQHARRRQNPQARPAETALQLEALQPRLLLSVLDFADEIIDEVEPNDTANDAQNLTFGDNTLALGIPGALADPADTDLYTFTLAGETDIDLKFQITGGSDQPLTALTVGPNDTAYFVANNTLWNQPTTGDEQTPAIVASAETIAAAIAAPADNLDIHDITVTDTGLVFLTTANTADVLQVDSNGAVSVAITAAQITTATGAPSADLVALAVADDTGLIYLADQGSAAVLVATPNNPTTPTNFTVAVYTAADTLNQSVQTEVFDDLNFGRTTMPTTVLAQTDGDFGVNSLVFGAGLYAPNPGEDKVFYTTQLGPNFQGDGSVTRIVINEADPESAQFTQFFAPDANQLDLNPSALVLDTSGDAAFGNKMYMGTFGPSLGDDQDGEIYTVEPDGTISEFVINAYVDMNGDPVEFDSAPVTGFFDITDMAFSTGGPFGEYLYVLSENIDQNGPDTPGGFTSDLWRVSPDGTAQLFVADIADGVISLAFDNSLSYGGDLFVATFQGGSVLRVEPDGAVASFFEFSDFNPDLMVSDVTFAPFVDGIDSPMEGRLVLTLAVPQSGSAVVQLEPNGTDFYTWAGQLQTGDVSSGDIAFDDEGNFNVILQTDKNITRLDYQTIFDTTFTDLQLRPEGDDPAVPYVSLTVADQPRIMRLSDSGDPDDISTDVEITFTSQGDPPTDGSRNVTFTFDDDGDIYLYIQNVDTLYTAARDDEQGLFDSNTFQTLQTGAALETATGLIDSQVSLLDLTSDTRVLAVATNGTDAGEGINPPSQVLDDLIVSLTNVRAGGDVETVRESADLTRMQVQLLGPGGTSTFTATGPDELSEQIAGQPAGTYTVTISSLLNNSGDYEMLVGIGGELESTIEVTAANSPVQLTTDAGDTLVLTYTGAGTVTLDVDQKPGGAVVAITNMTITGANLASTVSLVNQTSAGAMPVEQITLDSSVGTLTCDGTITLITAAENARGYVWTTDLGTVIAVDAPNFLFFDFNAQNMGTTDQAGAFTALGLRDLDIAGDLRNLTFFATDSTNAYSAVRIGGIIDNATFNGSGLNALLVENNQNADVAIDNCDLNIDSILGRIGAIEAHGDVDNSNFNAAAGITSFDLYDGDLIDTALAAGSSISRVYIEGAANAGSSLTIQSFYAAGINQIITGGNCAAAINTSRLNRLLCGFDPNGRRLREDNETFTGADLTSQIFATWGAQLINVTGSIDGASIVATNGPIFSLFAEDGFDATLSSGLQISRVMVGFLNGNRAAVVNPNADVAGTFSTPYLGRIYYTGTLDENATLPTLKGPIVDVQP